MPLTISEALCPPELAPSSGAREIVTTDFSICVPADWRRYGRVPVSRPVRDAWRGVRGRVVIGEEPRDQIRRNDDDLSPFDVRLPNAGGRSTSPVISASRGFWEQIGGRLAYIAVGEGADSAYVNAEWPQLVVTVVGSGPETRTLGLAIVRSVRFR